MYLCILCGVYVLQGQQLMCLFGVFDNNAIIGYQVLQLL